jgi:hypothetical protein
MKCVTTACEGLPSHRFTWPGHDECVACESCAARARGVAGAMGLHLQLIPLECGLCGAAHLEEQHVEATRALRLLQLEAKGSDEERACLLVNEALAHCPPGPAELDRLLGYIACSSDTEAVKVRAGVLARAVLEHQPIAGTAPAQKGSSRS